MGEHLSAQMSYSETTLPRVPCRWFVIQYMSLGSSSCPDDNSVLFCDQSALPVGNPQNSYIIHPCSNTMSYLSEAKSQKFTAIQAPIALLLPLSSWVVLSFYPEFPSWWAISGKVKLSFPTCFFAWCFIISTEGKPVQEAAYNWLKDGAVDDGLNSLLSVTKHIHLLCVVA